MEVQHHLICPNSYNGNGARNVTFKAENVSLYHSKVRVQFTALTMPQVHLPGIHPSIHGCIDYTWECEDAIYSFRRKTLQLAPAEHLSSPRVTIGWCSRLDTRSRGPLSVQSPWPIRHLSSTKSFAVHALCCLRLSRVGPDELGALRVAGRL